MSRAKASWKQVFASRAFVTAAAVLLVAAGGWHLGLSYLKIALAKAEVPLKAPLDDMPIQIGPFHLANNGEIPDYPDGKARLPDDIVEILGTEDYISWFYRDTRGPAGKAATIVQLHIAYYTELIDAVPHVPENCQVAGGAQAVGKPETLTWSVTRWADADAKESWSDWAQVPIRKTVWETTSDGASSRSIVFYVFNVNGRPVADREGVSKELANPFKEYVYYAKIELKAFGARLTAEDVEAECREFFELAAPAILSRMAPASEIQSLEDSR